MTEYIKEHTISGELQHVIDWENIMLMERSAGGHDEQMTGLFKGAELIAHYNKQEYSGQVATCVKLNDQYILYNDYYGSCCACDAWEGASDEAVKNMCINLANNAFIFPSLDSVKRFLQKAIETGHEEDYSDTFYSEYWDWCEHNAESSKYLLSAIERNKNDE